MAYSGGDALDTPIYGCNYRITFPIFDADGDLVTGAAGLDSEVSIDSGTFADCTNEATELATNSGVYYLDLTGAEMSGKAITVIIKTSTSGAKTTVIAFNTNRLQIISSGTAQAGTAGTITLAAGTSKQDNDLAGLYVRLSNNTPSGVQYSTRKIISNVASTQVATVESNWGTNPSNLTTYDLLSPISVNVIANNGTLPPSIVTAGIQDVNIKSLNDNVISLTSFAPNYWGGFGSNQGIVGYVGNSVIDIIVNGIDALITANHGYGSYLSSAVDVISIKAKTDKLTFNNANELHSDIKAVNGVTVRGTGVSGDEWGPQ